MVTISQQAIHAASRQVVSEQVSIDVAHRGAQMITFIDTQHRPLSWEQVSHGLVHDPDFCQCWNQTWADLPFDFEWKPVPIHPYTAKTHPFFAVVFPARFRPANPADFAPYLQDLPPEALTATFANFSGDAQLIIPQNTGDYGHIAAFCRQASAQAQRALWWQVGKRCRDAIAHEKAVWCNTHGHGVPWLHVRFDSRLKYSAFPPNGSISANSQAIWYKRIYRQALADLNYTIRPARADDEPTLWIMLMHAAHESSVAAVKENPALARYVKGWMRPGDVGMIAEQAGHAIGAAWLRLSAADRPDNKGYGYVADTIPELAIAVSPDARSLGVGTNLLAEMMARAQKQFPAVSLSVRADNPALALYQRVGFTAVAGSEVTNRAGSVSFTMVRTFIQKRDV
ncbi:MAG: N-acetyltransferase [Cyanobacteria bacterium J06598_3]